jgi:hypothetical protein
MTSNRYATRGLGGNLSIQARIALSLDYRMSADSGKLFLTLA